MTPKEAALLKALKAIVGEVRAFSGNARLDEARALIAEVDKPKPAECWVVVDVLGSVLYAFNNQHEAERRTNTGIALRVIHMREVL